VILALLIVYTSGYLLVRPAIGRSSAHHTSHDVYQVVALSVVHSSCSPGRTMGTWCGRSGTPIPILAGELCHRCAVVSLMLRRHIEGLGRPSIGLEDFALVVWVLLLGAE
jgi:hypothetical protein